MNPHRAAERRRELHHRVEREVSAVQELGDVRTGGAHAPGELGLRDLMRFIAREGRE